MDMLEMGRQVLATQPFSGLLGARLLAFSPEGADILVPVRPELLPQHGFLHGGVVSYAADNALTFAGGAALGPAVVTSEMKINYLRPAQGEHIVARARVVHAGSTQAVCRCEVFVSKDGEERLCAVALGTIARLGKPAQAHA